LSIYYAPGLDVVGLAGYSLPASDWPYGYAQSFSRRASSFNRSICFILCSGTKFKAFPVQLRVAYTLLLIICLFPPMRWIYWVPAVGTFTLVIFGYCLMARMLSLLPWNRAEPITVDLLRRTFLSPTQTTGSGRSRLSGRMWSRFVLH
jgi:hypothetical protein